MSSTNGTTGRAGGGGGAGGGAGAGGSSSAAAAAAAAAAYGRGGGGGGGGGGGAAAGGGPTSASGAAADSTLADPTCALLDEWARSSIKTGADVTRAVLMRFLKDHGNSKLSSDATVIDSLKTIGKSVQQKLDVAAPHLRTVRTAAGSIARYRVANKLIAVRDKPRYCEGLHRRCVEAITAAYTLTALNSMAHVESLAMMSELYDAVVEAQRFISETDGSGYVYTVQTVELHSLHSFWFFVYRRALLDGVVKGSIYGILLQQAVDNIAKFPDCNGLIDQTEGDAASGDDVGSQGHVPAASIVEKAFWAALLRRFKVVPTLEHWVLLRTHLPDSQRKDMMETLLQRASRDVKMRVLLMEKDFAGVQNLVDGRSCLGRTEVEREVVATMLVTPARSTWALKTQRSVAERLLRELGRRLLERVEDDGWVVPLASVGETWTEENWVAWGDELSEADKSAVSLEETRLVKSFVSWASLPTLTSDKHSRMRDRTLGRLKNSMLHDSRKLLLAAPTLVSRWIAQGLQEQYSGFIDIANTMIELYKFNQQNGVLPAWCIEAVPKPVETRSSSVGETHRGKVSRVRFSSRAVEQLTQFAEEVTENPNSEQRQQLAVELNDDPKRVKTWFRNYRAKKRGLALDGSESHTGSSARAAASAAASASGASSSHRQRRQRDDSDDDGDGVSSPATKRIRRKHFSHDAIATLQQHFDNVGQHPSDAELETLSSTVGEDLLRVRTWFANRRQKERRVSSSG